MNDRTFPLGVSEFTTCRWTFEQDVDVYARHGIDAIEVTESNSMPRAQPSDSRWWKRMA